MRPEIIAINVVFFKFKIECEDDQKENFLSLSPTEGDPCEAEQQALNVRFLFEFPRKKIKRKKRFASHALEGNNRPDVLGVIPQNACAGTRLDWR